MNKAFSVIALIVGILSGVIGLYQTFSFSHLPQVRARYACGGGYDTNVMEFLRDLNTYSGQIVMLDLNMCARDFNREVRGSSVTRFFDGETFLQAAGIDTKHNWPRNEVEWEKAASVIDDRLSVGLVSMRDITRDNGMRVTLSGIGQTANPFSSVTAGSEGVDDASGPFQISIVSQCERFEYMISPAPFTDRLAAEVNCARCDWPAFLKFLACPFL